MTTAKPATPDTMSEKAKSLFGSIRFWMVTAGAVVATLAKVGVITEDVAKIIITYLGTVVGIGTADSIAEKLSSKKPSP
jgi:hypothetical protein